MSWQRIILLVLFFGIILISALEPEAREQYRILIVVVTVTLAVLVVVRAVQRRR